MKSNKKSFKKYLLIIAIVLLFLILAIFGPFLKIMIISYLDRTPETTPPPQNRQFNEDNQVNIDTNLVGNWDTGCLIPKGNSDYAERHTFTFNSDGTSNHKRYIGGRACNNLSLRNDEQLTWEIVGSGKINFLYSTGGRIYDIYQISGNTLKFGHGFCDCSYGIHSGASEEDRFERLNDFLLYQKK